MKKTAMTVFGILLLLGCATLGASLLVTAVLPNVLYAYLMGTASSFSHDIFDIDMTVPYVFSLIEILAGAVGIFYFGKKRKD